MCLTPESKCVYRWWSNHVPRFRCPDGIWNQPGEPAAGFTKIVNALPKSVSDLTTGSVGVTIAFFCLVIMHGANFLIFKKSTNKVWWFRVHGKVLGWKIGDGGAADRY